ncbi:MAG: ATP-binding protein [Acidobacteriota bacterium]
MTGEPLAEALPTPLFVLRGEQLVYANPAFATLIGTLPEQLMDQDNLEFVHPDDRLSVRQWHAAAAGRELSAATFPMRVRRSDGAERTVLIATRRTVHAGEDVVVAVVVDAGGDPDAMAAPVRMAAVGRLAGGVAHDFNNLLLVIGGQVERLQRELAADHPLRNAVDAIGTASERAAMLTDQLLAFGRRQVLTPQVTDLAALLAETELRLRLRAGTAIQFGLACAADVPAVRADRPRFVQVLLHLIDNARDAMPEGGRLTVTLDASEVDADQTARWPFLQQGARFVRLRVEDTGSGMDPAVVPHVFEPFFTTKRRGRGAGMGLASVYGIVKQSCGYVFIERSGPDGTCVTLLLSPADEDSARRMRRAATTDLQGPKARILLVEDEMAVRELLLEMLSRGGFEVTAAETGEQARVIAGQEVFDVLVTDVDLPGMSGAQLASTLRARNPRIAVVMMSGYPEDSATDDPTADVRSALLRKPFSSAQLLACVRETLADLGSANR